MIAYPVLIAIVFWITFEIYSEINFWKYRFGEVPINLIRSIIGASLILGVTTTETSFMLVGFSFTSFFCLFWILGKD